jgi:formate dehydrogenase major subunit
MVNITINGKTIEVPEGKTVLQAARLNGIEIPTLCDHPAVKPYGGCRLCLVEVKGMRTLTTSCTLPVYDGMEIKTDTPAIHSTRRFILDMIFGERNHFCMYCQKSGGDCDLQNAAYDEGMTHWGVQPQWSSFSVDSSHPYFVVDHSRCILCRRCERACAELAGSFTLSMEFRGPRTMLTADCGVQMGDSSCVRCGTCVSVCPTGALIDRHSAYLGLTKDFQKTESVCVNCSLGCGVEILTRGNQLVRIEGNWDSPVNGGVICELGRYKPMNDKRPRLTTPQIRTNGNLMPVAWEQAIQYAAGKLQEQSRTGGTAALASPRLPSEALYTFSELFAGKLDSPAVATTKAESVPYGWPASYSSYGSLEDLKDADCVIIAGVDLTKVHQVAGFFIKRRLPFGLNMVLVDSQENGLSQLARYRLQPEEAGEAAVLHSLAEQLAVVKSQKEPAGSSIDENIRLAAGAIAAASKVVVITGGTLKPEGAAAAAELARWAEASLIQLPLSANSLAALGYGLGRPFETNGCTAAYLALGDEEPSPELISMMEEIPFLVVQASHVSPLSERADVIFPVESWAEQDGHYLNLEGRLQRASKALQAPGQARSNLSVLQSLASCLDYEITGEWQNELLVI